jgi:hypothetical protein
VAILTLRLRPRSVRKQIHHEDAKARRTESSCLRGDSACGPAHRGGLSSVAETVSKRQGHNTSMAQRRSPSNPELSMAHEAGVQGIHDFYTGRRPAGRSITRVAHACLHYSRSTLKDTGFACPRAIKFIMQFGLRSVAPLHCGSAIPTLQPVAEQTKVADIDGMQEAPVIIQFSKYGSCRAVIASRVGFARRKPCDQCAAGQPPEQNQKPSLPRLHHPSSNEAHSVRL